MTGVSLDPRCERHDKFNPGDDIYYYDKFGVERVGRVIKRKESGEKCQISLRSFPGYKIWVKTENLELQEG